VERLIVDIAAIANCAPVIPVLTVERAADAVPLARALVKGGLPVLEITLRTPVALDALRAMAAEVPEAILGAGTVLNGEQLDQARRAGARFVVSPSCTRGLAEAAEASGMPFLPGVQTASEAVALSDRGFRLLKFFPADQAGGLGWAEGGRCPLGGAAFLPDRRYWRGHCAFLSGAGECGLRRRFLGGAAQGCKRVAAAASLLKRR
jgi:2-dehydro-3-deoxyphosphogluconate aldolase/(4S)-4-hydroxy-2-oxoglutarate aldolase